MAQNHQTQEVCKKQKKQYAQLTSANLTHIIILIYNKKIIKAIDIAKINKKFINIVLKYMKFVALMCEYGKVIKQLCKK